MSCLISTWFWNSAPLENEAISYSGKMYYFDIILTWFWEVRDGIWIQCCTIQRKKSLHVFVGCQFASKTIFTFALFTINTCSSHQSWNCMVKLCCHGLMYHSQKWRCRPKNTISLTVIFVSSPRVELDSCWSAGWEMCWTPFKTFWWTAYMCAKNRFDNCCLNLIFCQITRSM